MHYWCVFEVVIVWLIGLSNKSHSGKLSSCKCRTKSTSNVLLVEHYTKWLMRKGTLWHFRANMIFLNIRVALDFKSTPLKTVSKNLDFTTELWLFPQYQVGRSFYWLFGTFHAIAASAFYPSSFEPSSFSSSSLTGRSRRTLFSADAQGHFLRSNPNWSSFPAKSARLMELDTHKEPLLFCYLKFHASPGEQVPDDCVCMKL